MKSIRKNHVVCDAVGGTEIVTCLLEAIALAAEERIEVQFVHNGRRYAVDPWKLADIVAAQHPDTFKRED